MYEYRTRVDCGAATILFPSLSGMGTVLPVPEYLCEVLEYPEGMVDARREGPCWITKRMIQSHPLSRISIPPIPRCPVRNSEGSTFLYTKAYLVVPDRPLYRTDSLGFNRPGQRGALYQYFLTDVCCRPVKSFEEAFAFFPCTRYSGWGPAKSSTAPTIQPSVLSLDIATIALSIDPMDDD